MRRQPSNPTRNSERTPIRFPPGHDDQIDEASALWHLRAPARRPPRRRAHHRGPPRTRAPERCLDDPCNEMVTRWPADGPKIARVRHASMSSIVWPAGYYPCIVRPRPLPRWPSSEDTQSPRPITATPLRTASPRPRGTLISLTQRSGRGYWGASILGRATSEACSGR